MAPDTGGNDDDPATAIRFGTSGWRAPLAEFTTERVRMVGQAVASYLATEGYGGDPVGVGYDARETSRGFAEELARVLAANGHDVVLGERDRPTPQLAWAIVQRDLAGGLMVTASHNPPDYNGIKFFPSDAAPPTPAVTDAIEDLLSPPAQAADVGQGSIQEVDFYEDHARHALELVDVDLNGLAVVYDAMHGSGREATDRLLRAAGAEVHSIRCTKDPTFGGTDPEPSAENLQELVETVQTTGAALGIANDGDADRVAIVTPERGYLDENLFFAGLYEYLLATDRGPAVRSVATTFLVDRVAEAHGQTVIEVPVGFKWVAEAMQDHDGLVGGEESGGFTVRGHIREKDGVLMGLYAAAMTGDEPMDDRIDRLLAAHGDIYQDKTSIACPDDRKAAVIAGLTDTIPDSVADTPVENVITKDGFKLLLADGSWVMVRPSGTEPMMRVYAEAATPGRVDELLDAGRTLVEPLL